MDKSMAELEISSYGVVDTSLEEVFLKVTESAANAETGTHSLHVHCILCGIVDYFYKMAHIVV